MGARSYGFCIGDLRRLLRSNTANRAVFNRIVMHVAQFFQRFLSAVIVERVESALPDTAAGRLNDDGWQPQPTEHLPVRAGWVSRPEVGRWSSYRDYASLRADQQNERCGLIVDHVRMPCDPRARIPSLTGRKRRGPQKRGSALPAGCELGVGFGCLTKRSAPPRRSERHPFSSEEGSSLASTPPEPGGVARRGRGGYSVHEKTRTAKPAVCATHSSLQTAHHHLP